MTEQIPPATSSAAEQFSKLLGAMCVALLHPRNWRQAIAFLIMRRRIRQLQREFEAAFADMRAALAEAATALPPVPPPPAATEPEIDAAAPPAEAAAPARPRSPGMPAASRPAQAEPEAPAEPQIAPEIPVSVCDPATTAAAVATDAPTASDRPRHPQTHSSRRAVRSVSGRRSFSKTAVATAIKHAHIVTLS